MTGSLAGVSRLVILRRVGALLLVLAAVVVMVGMAPKSTTAPADITSAMITDSLNQGSAQGAPQQSVVNGWTARDLLEIIAKQGEQQDHRPVALLLIAVLMLGLAVGTSSTQLVGRTDSNAPTPEAPTADQT